MAHLLLAGSSLQFDTYTSYYCGKSSNLFYTVRLTYIALHFMGTIPKFYMMARDDTNRQLLTRYCDMHYGVMRYSHPIFIFSIIL